MIHGPITYHFNFRPLIFKILKEKGNKGAAFSDIVDSISKEDTELQQVRTSSSKVIYQTMQQAMNDPQYLMRIYQILLRMCKEEEVSIDQIDRKFRFLKEKSRHGIRLPKGKTNG
jgi:hypothetical protein